MRTLLKNIMTGKDRTAAGACLKPLLWALSCFYGVIVLFARALYRYGICPVHKARKPVISVGNITAGGVGKTPIVIFIAEYFSRKGLHPVVLTRGYMAAGAPSEVPSDEAVMMAERLEGVRVVVDPDRVAMVRALEHDAANDIFIMDDGFQHWKLARDLDIVAIDATAPLSQGHVLPRGLLREPLTALRRAGLFVITKTDIGRDNMDDIRRVLRGIDPQCPVVETVHAPAALHELWQERGSSDLSPLKDNVVALSAIGAPDAFEATLRQCGAAVEGVFSYEDHHVYILEDAREIVRFCMDKKITKVVTTQKDAVKLRGLREAFQGVSLWVLEINLKVVHGETEFFSRLDRCLHP